MISVQSLVSDAAQKAHKNEARHKYFLQATEFFSDQFPVFAKTLTEEQKLEFVTFAYIRSRELGFKSGRDHLQCLVAFVFLGGFFDTDHQFYDDLYFAGWTNKNGQRPSLKRLCHQIDLFTAETRNDLASKRRIMLSIVQIYRESINYDIVSICHSSWPARASRIRNEIMPFWIQNCAGNAQSLGLGEKDIQAHCVLAMYFGHQFYRDPLYPWAMAAYADLPASNSVALDRWRMNLLDGVRQYFDDRTIVIGEKT